MNEIKRLQKLAGIITESTFDSMKQRLLSFGYPEDKVQTYCNDLESYGDEDDYEGISDKELKDDFETYSGEVNEVEETDVYSDGTPLNKPDVMLEVLSNMRLITKSQINNVNDNVLDEIGLYFWWIHEGAVDEMNVLFQNQDQPKVKACTWRNTEKGKYYLVYVGQAQGQSVRSRLVGWHLSDADKYSDPNNRLKIASGINSGGMSSVLQTVAYTIFGKNNTDITQPQIYQNIINWFDNHFLYGYLGKSQLDDIADGLGIAPQNVEADIDLYENKFLSHCYGALNYDRPDQYRDKFQRRNQNQKNQATLNSPLNGIKLKIPNTPHQNLLDYFNNNNIQYNSIAIKGKNYYNLNNITLQQAKEIERLGYKGWKWG